MKSRQVNRPTIHTLGIGICAALLAGFYMLSWQPAHEAAAAYHDAETKLEQRRASLNALEHEAAALQSRLDALNGSIAANEFQLRPAGAINQRLAALTELAGDCEVKLEQIKPGHVERGELYDVVTMELYCVSSQARLTEFLNGLHAKFLDMAVISLRLQARPAEVNAPLTGRFELIWYVQPGGDS